MKAIHQSLPPDYWRAGTTGCGAPPISVFIFPAGSRVSKTTGETDS
jgi:hypothetical protein